MLDSLSGYVKTVTIPNKRAKTILGAFRGFKTRLERRTGKKSQPVRCDSGTEFDEAFVEYTASQGIVKRQSK